MVGEQPKKEVKYRYTNAKIAEKHNHNEKISSLHTKQAGYYKDQGKYDDAEKEYIAAYNANQKIEGLRDYQKEEPLSKIYEMWKQLASDSEYSKNYKIARDYLERGITIAQKYNDKSKIESFSSELERLNKK